MHIFLIKNLAVGRILLFSHNARPWVGTYSYTFFLFIPKSVRIFNPIENKQVQVLLTFPVAKEP